MFPTVCVHNCTPGSLGLTWQLLHAVCDTLVSLVPKPHTVCVGSSSKIQTLCHMTQVRLKLSFTAMERLTGYIYTCVGILPTGC